ncbi:MAG TPA: hypothetical protein VEH07_05080, partial [Alphaproteobacteria bacterium]|nr:hypothetical protein [Alphaproteobacteria bacterium]
IERLMCDDTAQALRQSDIVIVGHATKLDAEAIAAHSSRLTVIDLQGNAAIAAAGQHDYQGICW